MTREYDGKELIKKGIARVRASVRLHDFDDERDDDCEGVEWSPLNEKAYEI